MTTPEWVVLQSKQFRSRCKAYSKEYAQRIKTTASEVQSATVEQAKAEYKALADFLEEHVAFYGNTKTATFEKAHDSKGRQIPDFACVEEIDYRTARGLDKSVIRSLTQQSAWVGTHGNVFVLGPTGVGKSFVACRAGAEGTP